MTRIKMLLMSAVVAVAMLVALSGPALAHDFCCDRDFIGDRFVDRGDLLFLHDIDDDDDCDVDDVDRLGNLILVEVDCDD